MTKNKQKNNIFMKLAIIGSRTYPAVDIEAIRNYFYIMDVVNLHKTNETAKQIIR